METCEIITGTEKAISEDHDLKDLYEQTFPGVAKFVRNMEGSFEDAKDIFHDALVIYMEITARNNANSIMSDRAYILGISKHLWNRKQKSNSYTIPLTGAESEISIPDDYFPATSDKRLLNFLKTAGKRCMDLLRAFYFRQLPVKKIVSDLGYSNEHSVSVQKYKCLEKLRNTVKEKSLTYDDFTG